MPLRRPGSWGTAAVSPRPRPRTYRPVIGPIKMLAQVSNIGLPATQGVYRIMCLPLRKAYVGSTYDLALRWVEHQTELWAGDHSNRNLQAAFDKFGPRAFTFEVLEIISGRSDQVLRTVAEQRWMDRHPNRFNVRPAGTNQYLARTKGGRAAVQAAAEDGRIPKFCKTTGRLAPTRSCKCYACRFHRDLKHASR